MTKVRWRAAGPGKPIALRAAPALMRWIGMTVWTGWWSRLLATGMVCLLAMASAAWAQEAPTAPVDPDKVLEAARKDLAALLRQQDKGLDDEADLQEFRKQALSVQSRAEEATAALEPRLTDARARLAQLGDAPAGAKEPPELAAQRAQLAREIAGTDAQVKLARLTAVEAGQAIAGAEQNRRMQLGARLGERVPSPLQSGFWAGLAREGRATWPGCGPSGNRWSRCGTRCPPRAG